MLLERPLPLTIYQQLVGRRIAREMAPFRRSATDFEVAKGAVPMLPSPTSVGSARAGTTMPQTLGDLGRPVKAAAVGAIVSIRAADRQRIR